MDKLNATVKVCFYDYGNTEDIQVDNLRKGEPRYFELAPQAVSFQMANIEASNESEWLSKELQLLREEIVYNDFSGQIIQVGSIGNPPILYMFDGVGLKKFTGRQASSRRCRAELCNC